jgi:hypothetical protein
MGTRNLTIVYSDGEYKVAKYCQWDGYPQGQGTTILNFLREGFDKDKLTVEVAKLREATEEEVQAAWVECGAEPGSEFVSMAVGDKMKENYPYWNRDMGGEIIEWIQEGKISAVQNDLNFAADSLFCEWAYVLDLDKNLLEVFEGFNKNPLEEDERFKFLEGKTDQDYRDEKYYPVRLIQSYSLSALPTVEKFCEDLTRERLEA